MQSNVTKWLQAAKLQSDCVISNFLFFEEASVFAAQSSDSNRMRSRSSVRFATVFPDCISSMVLEWTRMRCNARSASSEYRDSTPNKRRVQSAVVLFWAKFSLRVGIRFYAAVRNVAVSLHWGRSEMLCGTRSGSLGYRDSLLCERRVQKATARFWAMLVFRFNADFSAYFKALLFFALLLPLFGTESQIL